MALTLFTPLYPAELPRCRKEKTASPLGQSLWEGSTQSREDVSADNPERRQPHRSLGFLVQVTVPKAFTCSAHTKLSFNC